MPVEDHPVHERTRLAAEAKHGCFNRPPFKSHYLSKAGFSADGRQLFKRTPHVLSTECVTARTTDDPRCEGCRWKEATK